MVEPEVACNVFTWYFNVLIYLGTEVARRLKPSRAKYCRTARQSLSCYTAMARHGFKRRATVVVI